MYGKVRCPVCYTNIECNDTPPERCPSCKEYILDKLPGYNGTGINTAVTRGPGLTPLSDIIEDVY